MFKSHPFLSLLKEIEQVLPHEIKGQIAGIQGLIVKIAGITRTLSLGDYCFIESKSGEKHPCEIIGFDENYAIAMPFKRMQQIGVGSIVTIAPQEGIIYPHASWLGRVINALGEPIDGKGSLIKGEEGYSIHASPPMPHERRRLGEKFDLGVRAMNTFLTCCRGQRLGIFSGSGVGKTTLLGMVSRYSKADVNVVGLVGERGRELNEFIEKDLKEEGLQKSVIVAATSDESPLMRRQAAYLTLAIAEYFRDQELEVMCLVDSVTRFAMAMREIGLSLGEPPTTKGYTPSVFSELPKLLERAGPGALNQGDITAFFTVLVEGDDTNEPISDAVRGILDGHVILNRKIAERGRFPAIDILRSLSRVLPDCNSAEENALLTDARRHLSLYDDMAELIRLGAYRRGTSKEVDIAIDLNPALEQFLAQDKNDNISLEDGYKALAKILGRNAS
jgi:flagellum-specific ATP synthase